MSKFKELFLEALQEVNSDVLNEVASVFKSASNIGEVANTIAEKVNSERFKEYLQGIKPKMSVKCSGKSSGRDPYNHEQRISFYLTTASTYPQRIKEGYPTANVEITVEARVSDHDKFKKDPKIDVYIPQFGTEKTTYSRNYNIEKYDFSDEKTRDLWIRQGCTDIFKALGEKVKQMDKDLSILRDPQIFNLVLNNTTKFLMEYDFPSKIWNSEWFINWINQCKQIRNNQINLNIVSR